MKIKFSGKFNVQSKPYLIFSFLKDLQILPQHVVVLICDLDFGLKLIKLRPGITWKLILQLLPDWQKKKYNFCALFIPHLGKQERKMGHCLLQQSFPLFSSCQPIFLKGQSSEGPVKVCSLSQEQLNETLLLWHLCLWGYAAWAPGWEKGL